MIKRLVLALFMLAMASRSYGQATSPLPLPADRIVTGNITAANSCPADVTAASCVVINTQGTSTVAVMISGTWSSASSIISFEATPSDSGGWVAIPLIKIDSLVSNANTLVNGYYIGSIGGYRKFRVILYGTFSGPPHVVINASAGQTPKFEQKLSAPITATLLSGNNLAGLTYNVSNCTNLDHVQFSVNATEANPIVVSINISSSLSGPWVNYKKMNTGFDVPAIFNGHISAPYFQIYIPYDGTTAGDITIKGGCN